MKYHTISPARFFPSFDSNTVQILRDGQDYFSESIRVTKDFVTETADIIIIPKTQLLQGVKRTKNVVVDAVETFKTKKS